MKTIEEFIKEIEASEELLDEVKTIKDNNELNAFFKKHDCGATADEYFEYIKSQSEGEITDDSAEAAAGGYQIGAVCPYCQARTTMFGIIRICGECKRFF